MNSRRIYDLAVWKKLRKQALIRDKYLCQSCLENNRITQAQEVHHVLPVESHPELQLTLDNLQSLCRPCHEQTKEKTKVKTKFRARVIKA